MPFPDLDGHESFDRSFDFSGFPSLQEVNFVSTVGWTGGGLPWIPPALSTLRPTTSPRLSAIRLNFASPSTALPIKTLVKDTRCDLRQVADEIARIESEFEGVVNVTVLRDSMFEAVLCALNVRSRLSGWRWSHVDSPSFVPCRSFSTTGVEMQSVVAPPPPDLLLPPTGRSAASNCLVIHTANRVARTLVRHIEYFVYM